MPSAQTTHPQARENEATSDVLTRDVPDDVVAAIVGKGQAAQRLDVGT
jgi:hypothetical protein